MNKKQYAVVVVLVVISGFVGGVFSSRLFQGQAQAGAEKGIVREFVNAHAFRVVDKRGMVCAGFGPND
ncbi:MAG TPA: hypothetical protein EYP19_16780, partial [Desulfobacterales bacterium]|nr:hypothetical protein [Desulfobacterales bacterium]